MEVKVELDQVDIYQVELVADTPQVLELVQELALENHLKAMGELLELEMGLVVMVAEQLVMDQEEPGPD